MPPFESTNTFCASENKTLPSVSFSCTVTSCKLLGGRTVTIPENGITREVSWAKQQPMMIMSNVAAFIFWNLLSRISFRLRPAKYTPGEIPDAETSGDASVFDRIRNDLSTGHWPGAQKLWPPSAVLINRAKGIPPAGGHLSYFRAGSEAGVWLRQERRARKRERARHLMIS
jgi:hypothetical protein